MGWWKRMRNKLQNKKATGRPLRYAGHGDAYQDRPAALTSTAPAPSSMSAGFRFPRRGGGRGGRNSSAAALNEKALMLEDERFSSSGLRPSMGDSMFEPMSFELPRRPVGGGGVGRE